MDADGKAMTAETNSDGEYEFTGLRSDTVYVVAAVSEEGHYKVVRSRGSLLAKSAMTTCTRRPWSARRLMIPSSLLNGCLTVVEIMLQGKMTPGEDRPTSRSCLRTGRWKGVVFDPSADSAHTETVVELHRCLDGSLIRMIRLRMYAGAWYQAGRL